MLPPSLQTAKIQVGSTALPSNRDAQRKLASLLMLCRQIDSILTDNAPQIREALSRLESSPPWITEARRGGIDPAELCDQLRHLSVLPRNPEAPEPEGGAGASTFSEE